MYCSCWCTVRSGFVARPHFFRNDMAASALSGYRYHYFPLCGADLSWPTVAPGYRWQRVVLFLRVLPVAQASRITSFQAAQCRRNASCVDNVNHASDPGHALLQYKGLDCHPQHKYPDLSSKDCGPHECPWPGSACYLYSNCLLFISGRFDWPALRQQRQSEDPRTSPEKSGQGCPPHQLDPDSNGDFGSNGVWQPADFGRALEWLSAEQVVHSLDRTRLTMTGDSVMRQTFFRNHCGRGRLFGLDVPRDNGKLLELERFFVHRCTRLG